MALSRHAQCADECPLLGEKRTLTNRCLPISIYECRLQRREDAAASSAMARSSTSWWRASTMRPAVPRLGAWGEPQNCNQRVSVSRAFDRDEPRRFERFKPDILCMRRNSPMPTLHISQLEGLAAHPSQIQEDA